MTSSLVITESREGIAVIQVNNPPVNALGPGVPEGIEQAIRAAGADPAVRAIVLMGSGPTFIAGADIRQLEELAWGEGPGAPNIHGLLQTIEDCAKPVIMAIHGTALGGGLELAMAGHYRVAVRSARLGQPEVNLGIIPGAEGTQRLPRLVGVEKAMEMCVTGKLLTAEEAFDAGLIDAIAGDHLQEEAMVRAGTIAASGAAPRKTREQKALLKRGGSLEDAVRAGEELARKVKKNQIAPLKAIEAIRSAATLAFEDGCVRERELFHQCATSEQCRALIHAFFAERAATKVPALAKHEAALPVSKVFIVGAGTMGRGIAMACANAGLAVSLRDATQDALDTAMTAIGKTYDSSVQRGRLTPEDAAQRVQRIHAQLDHSGIESADLVIEAVFEDMALKRSVFATIAPLAKPGCILASNTSTLNIDQLAGATRRAESVVGLHFFSPANVMRLLEIVRGKETSPQVLASALAFAKKLSKVGVVVGNCPGFVGNRLMFPYMYEAQFMVEEGATPEQVDRALRGFGMAMGIFEVDDMAGLDVAWRVRRELGQFSRPGERKPLAADVLCQMGRFGQKTGKGWYAHRDGKPSPDPEVLDLVRRLAQAAAIPQRTFTDEQIVERAFYGLINEGAKVLEEGHAQRASDIDVIYTNGYGFPAWRGGPMFYADSIGLKTIARRISEFERELGPRWEPSPLLKQLGEAGKTFRAFDKVRATARGGGD